MTGRGNWPRIPIRALLLAGFLVTCAVPVIGFWIWTYNSVLNHEVEGVADHNLLHARNVGQALERYHLAVIEVERLVEVDVGPEP